MLDQDALLAPIDGHAATGEDLSFSVEFDRIIENRRADDPTLDQGAWQTDIKYADWGSVLRDCNQLLQTYALRAGYQVGQAAPRDLLYQLSLGAPGELLLREESRGQQGTDVSVRNRSLSVFGLDPYIRYDCPLSGIRCVLHNPADGTPLLSVLRDQQGAEELAKALSFLLRNLQQN